VLRLFDQNRKLPTVLYNLVQEREECKVILTLILFLAVLLVWIFGTREPAGLKTIFDESSLGSDLDTYLKTAESKLSDIVPGTEKRIIWHGKPHQKTPVSIVYLHGFSASSEEIRPVPDQMAQSLSANLYFARLTDHGRSGAAMAEATVAAWMRDTAEALAIAGRIEARVIVLSTSTGGTLSGAVACDPSLSQNVAGMVFVSPNFGINNAAARLLTWPFARIWIPLLVGRERHVETLNSEQGKYWTNVYPIAATLPMPALVRKVIGKNFGDVSVPALFIMSEKDQVVRPDMIEKIAQRWGGQKQVLKVVPGPNDDPEAHVLAGDILSPDLTQQVIEKILDWFKSIK
jgi:alpha-beta hydrolase superfamily lysophospholipase